MARLSGTASRGQYYSPGLGPHSTHPLSAADEAPGFSPTAHLPPNPAGKEVP